MNTINRTRYTALKSALYRLQEDNFNRRVDVVDNHPSAFDKEDRGITWGVNWSCCGTQKPQTAYDMANMLEKAADIATCLTEADLELDFEEDEVITELLNDGRRDTALMKMENLEGSLYFELSQEHIDWDWVLYLLLEAEM